MRTLRRKSKYVASSTSPTLDLISPDHHAINEGDLVPVFQSWGTKYRFHLRPCHEMAWVGSSLDLSVFTSRLYCSAFFTVTESIWVHCSLNWEISCSSKYIMKFTSSFTDVLIKEPIYLENTNGIILGTKGTTVNW